MTVCTRGDQAEKSLVGLPDRQPIEFGGSSVGGAQVWEDKGATAEEFRSLKEVARDRVKNAAAHQGGNSETLRPHSSGSATRLAIKRPPCFRALHILHTVGRARCISLHIFNPTELHSTNVADSPQRGLARLGRKSSIQGSTCKEGKKLKYTTGVCCVQVGRGH